MNRGNFYLSDILEDQSWVDEKTFARCGVVATYEKMTYEIMEQ